MVMSGVLSSKQLIKLVGLDVADTIFRPKLTLCSKPFCSVGLFRRFLAAY
jgi:hypothetical protein